MTTRSRFAVMTLVVGSAVAVETRADASPTARLVYVRGEGAETCPDEETLKQLVAARLGYDPFRPFVPVALFADVRRERGRLIASVKLVDEAGIERGARRIEEAGDDCNEIMATMALSMSIAIDPRSALKPPAVVPGSSEADASESRLSPESNDHLTAAIPPEHPGVGSPPRHRARSPLRFGVGLGLHGALGAGPAATGGAHLSGAIAWTNVSTSLELRGDLPASSNLATGGAVRTWLLGGALVPCWNLAWASFCAVGLLGRIQAETVDVAVRASEAFVFLAAGLRLAARFPISEGFEVRIAGDLLGTITPFVLDVDARRVYESSVVSGLAGATIMKFF